MCDSDSYSNSKVRMATSPTKTGASGAADLLWGEKSLPERFPGISGKELMEKIVEMYQAG